MSEHRRPHRGVSVAVGTIAFGIAVVIYMWGPSLVGKTRCSGRPLCLPEGWAWVWYLIIAFAWSILLELAIRLEKLLSQSTHTWQEAVKRPLGFGKEEHEHPLWGLFTTLWVLWAILVLGVEFFHPAAELVAGNATGTGRPQLADTTSHWLGIAIAFICIEAMCVMNTESGDTLSEHVWAFIHGEVTRAGIALGLVFLVLIRFVELGREQTGVFFGLDIGRLMVALGAGGWLVFHFIGRELDRHRAE